MVATVLSQSKFDILQSLSNKMQASEMIHRSFYVPLKVVSREQTITNSTAVSAALSLPSSELNGKQRWEAIICVCVLG